MTDIATQLQQLEEDRIAALDDERAAQRQCALNPTDATCVADLRDSRQRRERIEDLIAGLREQQRVEAKEEAARDSAAERKRREQAHTAAYRKLEEREKIAVRIDRARKSLQAELTAFEACEDELFSDLRRYPEIAGPVREALRQGGFRATREVVTAELIKEHVILPSMEFLDACTIVERRGHLELAKTRGKDARAIVDRILQAVEEELSVESAVG